MKYFFVANSAWYLSNFRASTLHEFSKLGEVTCVFPKSSDDGSLDCMEVRKRGVWLDPSGTNPIKEFWCIAQIFLAALHRRPDLIFSFNPKTNLYSLIVAWMLRIPCVPNVSGVGMASQLGGVKGSLYKKVASFFYRRARFVFFQNQDDLAAFVKAGWVCQDRADLIPGSGVDLSRFRPAPKKDGKFTFLLAARLIKNKGVLEYLASANEMAVDEGDSEFLVAGVPDYSSRAVDASIFDNLHDRSRIRFLGHVRDMPALLNDVDCVVLPSYYPEGIPRSLIEAASAGKVIITTDTPGCREVVNGNGLLIQPRSISALTEAMKLILNKSEEEKNAMKIASRVLAESRFDEKIVIGKYVKIAKGHF